MVSCMSAKPFRVGIDAHYLARHEGNSSYVRNLLKGISHVELPSGLEVIAYDQSDIVQYAIKTTVNAGGRAQFLDIVNPPSGAFIEGLREVQVCVTSPPDSTVAEVIIEYRPVDGEAFSQLAMRNFAKGACQQGTMYTAMVSFSAPSYPRQFY